MAVITDLPNELLEDIALKLRRKYYSAGVFGNVLAEFSLVCRTFYRVAFRYMHEELDLSSTEQNRCTSERLCSILRLIQINPERGYVVQAISIGPWESIELLANWGGIKTFKRSYGFLKRTVENLAIQERDIHELEEHPISVLITALLYLLPKVEYIDLNLRSSKRGDPLFTRWLLLAMDIAPLPSRERVKGIEFEYMEVFGAGTVPCRTTLGALLEFPNLESVRFSSEYLADFGLLGGNGHLKSSMESQMNKIGLSERDETVSALSPQLSVAYESFLSYDPFCNKRLLALRNISSITDLSFYNSPCGTLPIPDIIRASKGLRDFHYFVGSRTRTTRDSVQAVHQALLEHKDTLESLSVSYHKGFEDRHHPNFQLDFSAFRRLEWLDVSILLLADIDTQEVQMGDIFPLSLENLAMTIRYSSFGGGRSWDEAVAWVINRIVRMKDDQKLEKLKKIDVRVINHPAKQSDSLHLKEARRIMNERGIGFRATTYDAITGSLEL